MNAVKPPKTPDYYIPVFSTHWLYTSATCNYQTDNLVRLISQLYTSILKENCRTRCNFFGGVCCLKIKSLHILDLFSFRKKHERLRRTASLDIHHGHETQREPQRQTSIIRREEAHKGKLHACVARTVSMQHCTQPVFNLCFSTYTKSQSS